MAFGGVVRCKPRFSAKSETPLKPLRTASVRRLFGVKSSFLRCGLICVAHSQHCVAQHVNREFCATQNPFRK